MAGAAIDPIWRKWLPSDPTPAHWYDVARLERLAAAIVAADQESGRQRTVREFIADFRGLSGSAKQKLVLAQSGLSRMLLAELFPDGAADRDRFGRLLAAMQDVTKPVKAADIGIIGNEAIAQRFAEIGARLETFQYKRFIRDDDGIPSVIELAFGYCPSDVDMLQRRIIAGVNWSVSLANPFRQLGGQWGSSLDGYLTEQRIGYDALVAVFIHLACARVNYTDRGKSAVAMDSGAIDILDGLKAVTKIWTKQIKQEERHAAAEDKREERLLRATDRRETVKSVAWEIMEEAYLKASNNGQLPATARQVMYAARPKIQERTEKQLDDQYFTQQLLPDYITEHEVEWNVVFDDRGHFKEPHTGRIVGLGTLAVRKYLVGLRDAIDHIKATIVPGGIGTFGPRGCYSAILFIEKEGFLPLFESVQLDKRFDVGLISTKGMSVTAMRELVDEVCGQFNIPLLLLHDFDKSGFSIAGTLQRETRRYAFKNSISVIDLGLRLEDIGSLQREPTYDRGDVASRKANLSDNGASDDEIEILLEERVELNALTAPELVAFVENKLRRLTIGKVVPNAADLAAAYRPFKRNQQVTAALAEALQAIRPADAVKVPRDLVEQVQRGLKRNAVLRWDDVVRQIAGRPPNGGAP